MQEKIINRNKLMDVIIGAPMLFMFIGSIYLLIEGRHSGFYIGLLMAIVSPIVLANIIYKWIKNKPFVVLNEKGIYLQTIDRVIEWNNVSNIKLEEEDLTIKDAGGSGTSGIKTYLVVFEITERKTDGNYGFDRKLCTNFTNYSADDLLDECKKYWSYYKK